MKSRAKPAELLRAFDELQFGPDRTLNLRDSLPSPSEARARTEAWLRQKQVEGSGGVLVITGRGNNSPDGVSPVRSEVEKLLHVLRRRGVVGSWREHSPGSFAATPAPLADMLSAPRRHRDKKTNRQAASSGPIADITPETQKLLRQLAIVVLNDLGIVANESEIEQEMRSKFAALQPATLGTTDWELRLRTVIARAIEELNDRP